MTSEFSSESASAANENLVQRARAAEGQVVVLLVEMARQLIAVQPFVQLDRIDDLASISKGAAEIEAQVRFTSTGATVRLVGIDGQGDERALLCSFDLAGEQPVPH